MALALCLFANYLPYSQIVFIVNTGVYVIHSLKSCYPSRLTCPILA